MSRIDQIGQNGNDGLHYELNPCDPPSAYSTAVKNGFCIDGRPCGEVHEFCQDAYCEDCPNNPLSDLKVSAKPTAHADMVNKPPHYHLRPGYEVYDLRQDLAAKAQQIGLPHDLYSDWDRALEYLLRCWEKNELEDIKKARWYLDKIIGKLE